MAELHGSGSGSGGDWPDLQEHEGSKVSWFRYVTYDRIVEFEKKGWIISSSLGPPHNNYAVLMEYINGKRIDGGEADDKTSIQAD
jgi:hypothetical protein